MEHARVRDLAMIAVLALLASVPFQWSRGLYETTEGRYAECARQTLASGDLDDPILNGEHHWTKPPATYVAIMGGVRIFGATNMGARAYLIPCFVLAALAVYWLALGLFDRRTALISALVYLSSPMPLIASNAISTDPLLAFWEVLALALFWHGIRRGIRWPLALMWAALGMAFLTKGPPALLPLLGILPAYFVVRRRRPDVPALFNVAGLAAFAAVGFGWYVAEAWEHPGLARYWLHDEVVARTITGEVSRNPEWYKGPVIYLPILLLGTGPWLIMALVRSKGWRRGFRIWEDAKGALSPERLFLLLAVALPLLVFLVSKSKLPMYILPLFAPLAVAIGRALAVQVDGRTLSPATAGRIATVVILLFVAGKAIAPSVCSDRDMQPLARSVLSAAEAHPGAELRTYGPRLNGLQFYLKRQVPALSYNELLALLSGPPEDRPTTILVVRREHLPRVKPRGSFETIEVANSSFCLVVMTGGDVTAAHIRG